VWTPQATTNRERQYQVRFDQHSDALDDAISHRACTRRDWLFCSAPDVCDMKRTNFVQILHGVRSKEEDVRAVDSSSVHMCGRPGRAGRHQRVMVWWLQTSVQVQGCAGPREHPVVVYARSEQRRRSAAVERGAFCLDAHCHLRVDANAFSPWFMESW
jgi:hypothetical protein